MDCHLAYLSPTKFNYLYCLEGAQSFNTCTAEGGKYLHALKSTVQLGSHLRTKESSGIYKTTIMTIKFTKDINMPMKKGFRVDDRLD